MNRQRNHVGGRVTDPRLITLAKLRNSEKVSVQSNFPSWAHVSRKKMMELLERFTSRYLFVGRLKAIDHSKETSHPLIPCSTAGLDLLVTFCSYMIFMTFMTCRSSWLDLHNFFDLHDLLTFLAFYCSGCDRWRF